VNWYAANYTNFSYPWMTIGGCFAGNLFTVIRYTGILLFIRLLTEMLVQYQQWEGSYKSRVYK